MKVFTVFVYSAWPQYEAFPAVNLHLLYKCTVHVPVKTNNVIIVSRKWPRTFLLNFFLSQQAESSTLHLCIFYGNVYCTMYNCTCVHVLSYSWCKCLNLLVLFLPQMSSHVGLVQLQKSAPAGPVTTANVYTSCSCFCSKCLYVLVLFLLQMLLRFGPVPTANVYTCWSCSYCKCLYELVLFLLHIYSCVGPVCTANIYMCWSSSYCKCLQVLVLYLLQMFSYFK